MEEGSRWDGREARAAGTLTELGDEPAGAARAAGVLAAGAELGGRHRTLPHQELIAKLHSLTNLRAVRDDSSSTGWTIELGPFPGWATVPVWNS